MKRLLLLLSAIALTFGAQAQAPRSATDRAALIHSYGVSLREQATMEARELARLLQLNESEMQLVREFATARLQAENEAKAQLGADPESRRAQAEQAAATFQSRVVNILNDRQLQAYLGLLASQAAPVVAEPADPTPPVKPKAKSKSPRKRHVKTHRH